MPADGTAEINRINPATRPWPEPQTTLGESCGIRDSNEVHQHVKAIPAVKSWGMNKLEKPCPSTEEGKTHFSSLPILPIEKGCAGVFADGMVQQGPFQGGTP
jgi:hypothetical protein